jgi:long-chain acyl-CoA synthetase
MNVANHLERSARYFPQHPALVFRERTWTYWQLNESASRAAAGLAALGIQAAERVCLLLPNSAEFVISYFGLQKIGAVPISLNVMLKAGESAFIANDSGSVAFIVDAGLRDTLPDRGEMPSVRHVIVAGESGGSQNGRTAELGFKSLLETPETRHAVDLDRDALAAILYTSGTTGYPKGAMLSHSNVVSNANATKHHLSMAADDRLLCVLPLFHVFGQNFIMNAGVLSGSTLYLHERFVPDEVIRTVQERAITIFYGVPTVFIHLLNDPRVNEKTLESLRICFSAAATMPREVSEAWAKRIGKPIVEGYGLTECSPFASYNHELEFRFGSVGTPIENVEIKILDADDREVPVGELGEICIRGPNVMLGYFGRPDDSAEALRGGWLHSGDIGRVDEDGYVYIVDRVKDMINVAGFKVYPREVEEVLFAQPSVKEAAVVGIPDPLYGEAVKAFVVPTDDTECEPEQLLAACRDQIAEYKVPRQVELIAALPKSPTGKVLKRELRGR